MFYSINIRSKKSLWRNRLARSAVNRKVGGSSPPRDVYFDIIRYSFAAAKVKEQLQLTFMGMNF